MASLTQLSVRAVTVATRPEEELLLCCSRTCLASETAERIRTLLQEDIDWAYLIQKANQHGVMPLLYCSLKTTCPEAVPNAVLNYLQADFHTNAIYNWYLTEELLKLLSLFEAHGIPAIPFKGPVLAVSAYSNLALRQFCDLDILVHERDIQTALNLLISQGYQPPIQLLAPEKPYIQFEQFIESAEYQGSYEIAADDGKVLLELHWKLTPKFFPFAIDLQRSWENLQPISLAGSTVLNFLPEEMLLILCMHGTKDGWQQLKWICDVAELIRAHPQMDWERVMEQASRSDSKRMLFFGLLLANSLLGTVLPEAVWQKMQVDSRLKLLVAQVREQLFSEANTSSKNIKKFWLGFRAREKLLDRIHFCFYVLMTPCGEDWEFLPLPASLVVLYYLVRPIRLVRKYGLSVFGY